MALKYKRVLLKLSGESLLGNLRSGIDPSVVARISEDIIEVVNQGVLLGIVIGGGNIFRGTSGVEHGISRLSGDYMGMLATVMNSLALQDSLEQRGIPTCVMSAIPMVAICEQYIRRKALSKLQKGVVMIYAAGSGNPFFTTDTAAALRGSETKADVILKATKVDGAYSCDPKKNESAKFYENITYRDVITQNLKVMDLTAVALAEESKIPILVFSILEKGNLNKVLHGEGHFTTIS